MLKPLERNGVGFALTVGLVRIKPGKPGDPGLVPTPLGSVFAPEPDASTRVHYDPYLNAIASVSLFDDRAVVHLNVGALRDTSAEVTRRSWGVGAELEVTARVYAIAETYGLSDEKPGYQAGIRYWVVPQRLQVDGTVGRQNASPDNLRWISLGVRVLW